MQIAVLAFILTVSPLCDRCQHSEATSITEASKIASKRAGVKDETPWVIKLIEREHGYDVDDQSRFSKNRSSGAYGLGQFMPGTWATVGIKKTDCAVCQIEAIYLRCKWHKTYLNVQGAVMKWDSRAKGYRNGNPYGGWW